MVCQRHAQRQDRPRHQSEVATNSPFDPKVLSDLLHSPPSSAPPGTMRSGKHDKVRNLPSMEEHAASVAQLYTKHTLNHKTKLGLACLAKLQPIFSKHAQKAKDKAAITAATASATMTAAAQASPQTMQDFHLPLDQQPVRVLSKLKAQDVPLTTLETTDHTWHAIVDDMAKFMYPSLNLEGHDLTNNLENVVKETNRLRWQRAPQFQNPVDATAVLHHQRLTDAEQHKLNFDHKLQVAEKMLRLAAMPSFYPLHDDNDENAAVVVSASITRTLPTRTKLKALQSQTSEAAKTLHYADKRHMLSKWSQLQVSRTHDVPRRTSPPPELSPRTLYFEACTDASLLPEPLLSRLTPDRALNLGHFGLGDTKTIVLAKSLAQLPNLFALDLTDNRLSHQGISSIVQHLRGRHELQAVNLSENELGDHGGCIRNVADFLAAVPHLTHLDLSHTNLTDAFDALAAAFAVHGHLVSVNLSNNDIGDVGGQLLGTTLAASTCAIRDLDLSWNHICQAGAIAIGRALHTNACVHTLNLSMNQFGDAGAHEIAAALLVNRTLQRLDLSRNNLTGSAAVTLSYCIRHNPTLQHLGLLHNAFGSTGTKALLRSVARGIACDVSLSHSQDTASIADAVFDPFFPAAQSPFELRLDTSPYDYVLACELVHAAVARRCELFDMTFTTLTPPDNRVGIVHDLDLIDDRLIERTSRRPFELHRRNSGILRVSARYIPWPIQESTDVTTNGLVNMIKVIKDRISTREMCAMLEVATSDMFLSMDRVGLFVEYLGGSMDVVDIVARILHCVVDGTQLLSFVLENLTSREQNRLMASHGVVVLQFNPFNPTGKWSLDLSDPIHRKLALWFSMINRDEAITSQRLVHQRGNTSQRGTFANFRNERFNGTTFEWTDRFFDMLPRKGMLEFDYVSTTRPEDGNETAQKSHVMSEAEVNELLETIGAELWTEYVPQHKRLDLKRQVVLLQHGLSGVYVTVDHVRMLMQYFPKSTDNLRLKAVLAAHRSIVDMEHFDLVYEKLVPNDRKAMFTILGYMNTLNPLHVDMDYELAMHHVDHRALVKTLVEMIAADPLDLIKLDDESIQDGWSIYSMFSPSSLPTTGRMGFRYITRANKVGNELFESRRNTFHAFLFAGRLRQDTPPPHDNSL
ncbi:unnamed protein product [Aphanomyces euteiches]